MSIVRTIFMRAFGRPQGVLGRLGGVIMARVNADCGVWVAGLLEVRPDDAVLEVGFGPGVIIQRLASLASSGRVAGIDQSQEMFQQASARNAAEIRGNHVDLKCGSVESLPFNDNSFDKVIAINSMRVWPDAIGGLREVRRVMTPGGRIALGFTLYSGQRNGGLLEILTQQRASWRPVCWSRTRDSASWRRSRPKPEAAPLRLLAYGAGRGWSDNQPATGRLDHKGR